MAQHPCSRNAYDGVRRRWIGPLVAAAAVALVLGACGTTPPSGAPPAAADTGAPVPMAPSATPVAAGGLSTGARAYVDAVNRGDLGALVDAFAPDGEVVDVSRHIRGADAIRRWADNEVIGGSLRVDGVAPLDPATQRVRVHWAPSGSAGWAADYTFTTRGDRVTVADLQYAR